ncbi:MAG: hypothetical protein ABSD73_12305 [Candidatus Bathyarchaeia archaeon]|jgi:hypothetical protein
MAVYITGDQTWDVLIFFVVVAAMLLFVYRPGTLSRITGTGKK